MSSEPGLHNSVVVIGPSFMACIGPITSVITYIVRPSGSNAMHGSDSLSGKAFSAHLRGMFHFRLALF